MKTLLELKDVGRKFVLPDGNDGAAEEKTILDHINLQVTEGEFLAILGPSGSGKSTLLRIMCGLIPASSGQVLCGGKSVQGINTEAALVFQSFALFPWLTVQENVMLGLENQDISRKAKEKKSLEVLDIVGLDGFENAYPRELSGGMRQRVGIGRALVSEPDILLMDEAFSALDVLTAENLRRDLLRLWRARKIPTKAIVLVTHGIEEAVFMADRAVLLSSGPATIVEDIAIALPEERDRKSPEFLAYVDRIYSLMMHKPEPPEKKQPQRHIVKLPLVTAGALTGFLELLADLRVKMDLYKLADRFMMDTEDFFPLVEAGSLLHFTAVVNGDIELTPQGRQFAQATVLERKEIFRDQLLAHLPFVRQMLQILQSKKNRRMNVDFFVNLLTHSLGEEAAEAQLNLLIGWERYAELVAYDDNQEMIYLEPTEIQM